MTNLILYLTGRLQEASTWAGISNLVAGVFGLHLSSDLNQALIAAGIAVAGVAAILIKEKNAESRTTK
ncbi:MAG TPA: hypothetical protein VHL08_04560 [Dongiaceae bacterium]|jgi:hypothetical protein|nr:hypothetical protein [Dongiaceae bacterium]